jgi:hypothetical protein
VIEREKSTAEYLKCQYEERKSVLKAEQQITTALSHSKDGIMSLQQATKQLLQSIKHIQTTFTSILPSQQHEDVASRIPTGDKFEADWRVALDCLSNASGILEQGLGDTTERVRANQVQLLVHDSLRPCSAGDGQIRGEHPRIAS